MEKKITAKFTKKEYFALMKTLRGQIKSRHNFGVVGLATRIYEGTKEVMTSEEYEAFREEWKQVNPPEIQMPKLPKKKSAPPKPEQKAQTYTSYDPSKETKGVWRAN